MTDDYEEFKRFVNQPGAKAMIEYRWMAQGCPHCGCLKWSVTCDYWAYCMFCGAGFTTDYPMASQWEVVRTIEFDENGKEAEQNDNTDAD